MTVTCERKGTAAVAWLKGSKHKFYEDRYRLLGTAVPLVGKSNRGELFAVFDGMGSAPQGMQSAQYMCDMLLNFYMEPDQYPATVNGII